MCCMSAVLRLPCNNGEPNNIFLIYDFKQVENFILMVMYVEKFNTWKKVFVNYVDNAWDTEDLVCYTNHKTYKQICTKLRLISPTGKTSNEKALNLEQTMLLEANFMLGLSR